MNLACLICGGVFTEWDTVVCDGCQRPTHRDTCGLYDLIEREGELTAYFFCHRCDEVEDEQ